MKTNTKLILRNKPNSEGLLPIWVYIYVNGRKSYMATGVYIAEKQWDNKNRRVKNHPLAQELNEKVNGKLLKVIHDLNKSASDGKIVSAKSIKAQSVSGKDMKNFFQFSEEYIREVKHKRASGTIVNYNKFLNTLEDFHGSRALFFEEIDVNILKEFEIHLVEEELSNNYINAVFKVFKLLFNAAIKKQLINNYPFKFYDNVGYVSPTKDYLTDAEIVKLEAYAKEEKNNVKKQTAIYYLFGCFTGLRISDWYAFNFDRHLIKTNEIKLRPKKTANTNKWVYMRVHSRLAVIFDLMKQNPLDITSVTLNREIKKIALKLGIDKHLSSHCGRHTFAITLCLDNKISAETTAELMGIKLKTFTENYSQVSKDKIDRETGDAWEKYN